MVQRSKIKIVPVAPEHWRDIETLFGERGACGGCWCMAFRKTRQDFAANKGKGNRRALKTLVTSGAPCGVLAFSGDRAIAWCAIAPKSEFPVLLNSRNFAALQGPAVWSVTCFFIAKDYRRKGLSRLLLEGAVKLAKKHGAKIVEGYPHELHHDLPPAFVWTGIAKTFREAGFHEPERKSRSRPVMQRQLA